MPIGNSRTSPKKKQKKKNDLVVMKRTIFVRSINYACKLIMKVHNGRTEFGYSFETIFVCPEKDTEIRLYHVLSRHFSLSLRRHIISAAALFVYAQSDQRLYCSRILAKSKISRLYLTSEVE